MNEMAWHEHSDAFKAEWILRYMRPGDEAWKQVLDHILLIDRDGTEKFVEERGILFYQLSRPLKIRLIKTIPKKAHYILDCLKAFWKMNFQQDLNVTHALPAESPWLSKRIKITFAKGTKWIDMGTQRPTEGRKLFHTDLRRAIRNKESITHEKLEKWGFSYLLIKDFIKVEGHYYQTVASDTITPLYFAHTMEVSQFSDLFHREGRRFTRDEWTHWVRVLHSKKIGSYPSDKFAEAQADKYNALLNMIGHGLEKEIIDRSQPLQHTPDGTLVAIASANGNLQYGYTHNLPNGTEYTLVYLDALGIPHTSNNKISGTNKQIYNIGVWMNKHKNGPARLVGANHNNFPHTEGWTVSGIQVKLDEASIEVMTKALSRLKFQEPPSQAAWQSRFPNIELKFPKIWKTSPLFATPKDMQTLLKLWHRNLFVAKTDKTTTDPNCKACHVTIENMIHLAECPSIWQDLWTHVVNLMRSTGMIAPEHQITFILFGRIKHNKYIDKNRSAILFIAWRCLYAGIIADRFDNIRLNLLNVYKKVISILHSRLTAYGAKWKLWVNKNKNTKQKHIIPEKKRNKILLKQEANGDYQLHSALINEITRLQLTQPTRTNN